MSESRKKKILFLYRNAFQERVVREIAQGVIVPTDFLYGMNEIDTARFDVACVVAPRGKRRSVAAWLGWLLEAPFARIARIGLPVEMYPMFRRQIRSADVLVCANDAVGLSILLWKCMGFIPADVFVLSHGLAERLKYFERRKAVRWFIRYLLAKATHVFTVSDIAQRPLRDAFGVPQSKLSTFRFGVDPGFWKPAKAPEIGDYVLSIGNDMNRDYDTLIEAMPRDRDLIIVTRRKLEPRGRRLTCISGLSDAEIRDLYQRARYVVIPNTKLTYQSSGVSTCFQSMACGKATITADAPPLREVFAEGEDCLFYEAGDPESLRRTLERLDLDEPQIARLGRVASDRVRERYTTAGMANAIMSRIH